MASVPVGSEFQVNLFTPGNQTNPAIATNATGQTITVWEDVDARDSNSSGIYARLYDAGGNPVTGDFLVNTFTSNSQNTPAVAIDASGNFVVTWTSFGQRTIVPEFTEIYAQRFASNGTAIGGEFLVNTTTNSFQNASSIAMDSSGNFVVAWESLDQDGDGYGTYIRRFSAGGAPISGELLVNATTTGDQLAPDVAMNATGNSVVVWSGAGTGDATGVFARLYNSAGVAQGSEILVNTTTANIQGGASVAIDPSGNFVVVWTDQNGVDSGDIRAQRFNNAGTKLGGEFVVNTTVAGFQTEPDITVDSTGNFTITWTGQDASGTGIFARQYNSAGVALGNEFLVNTVTANEQGVSAIASDNNGNLTIAYTSGDTLAATLNILAQRYGPPPTVQFSQATYQIGENGVPVGVQLTLNRSGSVAGVTSQVQLAITGGSAQGGAAAGGGNDYNNTGFPRTITFAAGQTTQTVTIPIFQDLTIEPIENINLQISSLSNATIGAQSTTTLQILDDDTQYAVDDEAPIVSEGNTGVIPITFTVTRTGTTAATSIDFSFGGTATNGVDYVLTGITGTGITVTGNTINFAVGATTATLNVNVIGDQIDELDEVIQVNLSNPSPSGTVTVPSVITTITDDDTAGITVTQSAGSTDVAEGGATDTYTIALDSIPTAAVAITITPTAQLDLGSGAGVPIVLNFAADATALTAQTITVTAVDDTLVEGSLTSAIAYSVSSTDPTYNGRSIPNTVVNVADNDVNYALAATATSVAEGNSGTTPITFTITRSGAIDSASSVDLSFAGTATLGTDYSLLGATGTGITLAGNTVNFAANATTATITVDVIGDQVVEANEIVQLSLTNATASGTATVTGSPGTTTITDDDTAGVAVTQTGGSTDVIEGGTTDTYTIALTSVPTATVTVTLTPDAQIDLGNGAGVALTLTFAADGTALNPQTITVTAIDDAAIEGNHTGVITQTVSSSDPIYNGLLLTNLTTNVADNDISYAIAAGSATVTEGNSGTTPITFTITRSGATDAVSSIDFALGGTATGVDYTVVGATGTGITLTGNTINFAANATSATLTLNVTGEQIAELDETVQVSLANATAPGTATITTGSATTTIANDDTAGITVVQSGGTTTLAEGGATDTYTIALTSVPTAAVTVTITPNAQIDLGSGAGIPITLTFAPDTTALNPQTVTVTAIDDTVIEGNHTALVTHTVSSPDPVYNGAIITDISADISDNDVSYAIVANNAAITEGDTGSTPITFTVTRAGATNTISTVDLSFAGTATLAADFTLASITGTGISAAGNTITFAAGATTATVTLDVVGDRIAEVNETIQVGLTNPTASGTATITGTTPVTTTINDDDIPGITIVQSGGTTTVTEGGATDTYTIALNTIPLAAVTVTVTPTAQLNLGSGAGTPVTLTFAADATALTPQTVTVTAVDDTTVEGDLTALITHTVSSPDLAYNGIAIADITTAITDNDLSYSVVATTPSIPETNSGNTPITFTITRSGATNWTSTVDFALSGTATNGTDYNNLVISGTGITSTGNTINFAAGATTATLTLNALGDQIAEPDETVTVTLSNPTAPGTAAIATGSATTTLTNDDIPGITVTQSGGTTSVTEGGFPDTYSIALNTVPTAPVTVTVTPSNQLNLGSGAGNPITLTFAAGVTALTPQIITVAAIDNTIIDGTRTVAVTHTVTSADPNYNGLAIANISATLADNDVGYSIASSTPAIAEGDTDATPILLTVTRSGVTNTTSTVNFALSGTAINGVDYTVAGVTGTGISTTGNTINFATGATTATIALSVIGDRIQEPDKTIEVSLTNPTAPGTATLLTSSVSTTITNDDTAGVIITPSGGNTVLAEGGATDTYQLALATVPTGTVEITMQSDADSEISLDGTNFAQTQVLTRNDITPLTITVRAIDDRLREGTHTSTITHAITGTVTDSNYPVSLLITPITATITDNDRSGSHQCLPGLRLIGTKQNDVLRGGRNRDVIQGRAGDDRLLGRGCDDRISGSLGNDFLWGGAGDDLLTGGSQQDTLNGGGGNDILGGGPSRDRLIGGNGRDTLRGGKGVDILIGGAGNDILIGGNLNDIMTGGTGADRFVYQTLAEAGDRITDFDAKQDVIDLRQLSRNLGGRRLSFLGPDVNLVQAGSSTEVRIDPDGTLGSTTFTTLVVLENVRVADLSSRNFLT